MKIIVIALQLITMIAFTQAQKLINVNPDPKGDPWLAGGFRELSIEELNKIPYLILSEPGKRAVLPSMVYNGSNKYFRGIILQLGGSCSQASGIGYAYTYELNFLRGRSSKDSFNQYPPGYTYNFLNGGSQNNGSNTTDGWQIIKENGCPNLVDYGGLYALGEKGWMTGYDKYYNGMYNRVTDYYKIDVGTPAGLNTMKRYLYDHGNGSAVGGLVNFSAGIATAQLHRIFFPYKKTKYIVTNWSDPVDHAMTFVGYDDSVRYDFNGDGKYTNDKDINGDSVVDMRDWEIGAMIIANSWGPTWGDTGYAYMPYRLLALKVSEGGISGDVVYTVVPKPVNKPTMTLKVNLSYSNRQKISIHAGVAEYVNATKPDYEINFIAFDKKGGPYPVQGNNNDSIEIGLDISPLLQQTTYEPVKFFLKIMCDNDTVAHGILNHWSLLDYRNGLKEYYSKDTNLAIVTNGITISSITLPFPGEPVENLVALPLTKGVLLQWNMPHDTTGIIGYQIFKDGKFFKFCTDTNCTDLFAPNGTAYKVKALYKSGLSSPSNTVVISNEFHLPVAGSGYSLKYDGIDDCVNCGSGINIANHDFTIEFWAKRNPDPSNEFVIGAGKWNHSEKGLHIGFRDNRLMCGFWGDDVYTDQAYTDPDWHHWAITYDTTTMMQRIFRDGVKAGERKASANFGGTGNFYIGCMSGNTWFYNGEIDEVRVWNYVRSQNQIDSFIYFPLQGNEPGLLGYWRFDERSGDTLTDHSGHGNNGVLTNFSNLCWTASEAWAKRSVSTITDTIHVFAGYSKYGHPVSIELLKPPRNGSLAADTPGIQFLYKPYQEFYQVDSFIYAVKEDTLVSTYKVMIYPNFPLSIKLHEQNKGVSLFPNPANDHIKILMENPGTGKIEVAVYDIFGKTLLKRQYQVISLGQEIIDLDIKDLPNAVYSLSLKSENINQLLRFAKQH